MKRRILPCFIGALVALLWPSLPVLGAGSTPWTWRELTPSEGPSPEARRNGTAVYDPAGKRVIIFGGIGAGGFLNDVWAFDVNGRSWKKLDIAGNSPEPRLGHNALYDPIGHQMVVWAGQQGNRFFNDTWTLNLTTLRWTDVSPSSRPKARYGSASVFDPLRERLIQFAGFTEEGTRFQDTQAFSLDALRWEDLTPGGTKPQVRCLHTAAYHPTSRRMIVYGGQRSGALDDLWAFDLNSNAWTQLTPAERPAGRYFAVSFVDREGQFLVFGGNTTGGNVNETWGYSFETQQWNRLDISGAPSERNGMMAAHVEGADRFIVFGGTGSRLYNDVWELSRDADSNLSDSGHFAQFADGASWTSSFVLTNPSNSLTATGSVSFFNDLGEPLPLAVDGRGPAPSVAFSIPPLGSATFGTEGTGNLVSGWARVTSSSRVGGVIKFTAPGLGTAGVGVGSGISAFIAPMTRSLTRRISTGIAIAAVGEAVQLTLALRNSGGELVPGGQISLTLAPNGHVARFLEQLFPDTDTREFEGTLTVSAVGGNIVATALQLGSQPGEFTTLPVTALP